MSKHGHQRPPPMNTDEIKITITKFDAMRRQLRTGITLWFHDDDPVAVHTLVFAAHELLHHEYRKRGFSDLLLDSKRIKPEFRQQWSVEIKKAANFFKHARYDIASTFDFVPFINDLYIMYSVVALKKMGFRLILEEEAFVQWVWINRPDLVNEDAYNGVPMDAIENLRGIPKAAFLLSFFQAFHHRFDSSNSPI
jgi:hypothetical protein